MNQDHAGTKAELRQSFSLRVVAAVVGILSTFLLTVFVVRTLDPREAASFFAILASLGVGPLLGRPGLGPNVIRLIPAEPDPEKKRTIAATHLLGTLALTLPTAPVVALAGTAGLIGHSHFVPALLLTTAIITIETVRLMLSDIFAALGRLRASVATMHYVRSAIVLPAVVLVVMVDQSDTLITLLTTYAIVAALQLAVALVVARHDVGSFRSVRFASLRQDVGNGTRLFSIDLSWALLTAGTVWLANAAFEPMAAAHFAVAASIATQVTILEGLASLAVTPPAARLWAAGKRQETVRMLSNVATINAAVTVFVVAALTLLGSFALGMTYGDSMRDAHVPLMILAASGIAQAAFGVNIALLIVAGHIKELARTAMTVLAVVIPCAVWAAFLGGPLALAVVASSGVAMFVTCEWLTARRVLHDAPRAHWNVVAAARELLQRSSDLVQVRA